MKKVLLLLALSLTASVCFALPSTDQKTYEPFRPKVKAALANHESRLDVLDALPASASYTADGISAERVARVSYSVTADGGAIGSYPLGVSLPAKAVIIRSYFRITTQFVDAGSGTVALSCEDANNIKTATDITGSAVGAFVEGQSTGAISAAIASIAAACEITATVAGADQSAGALTAWVHYVVHD